MKKHLFTIFALAGLMFSACQGPTGPPGPPGPAGPQGPPGSGEGVDISNEVFEVELNFSADNDYFQAFNLDPAIAANDIVLIYMLWEVAGNTDIWRPLPQTLFLAEGILQYNFDFTTGDFGLFMEGNFDLGTLGPQWTDNQVFRVVLVPGQQLAAEPGLATADYETVVRSLGLGPDAIRKIDMRRSVQ